MEDILPPTPPGTPTTQKDNKDKKTGDIELLPPTMSEPPAGADSSAKSEADRKGFLSRLFTKNRQSSTPEITADDEGDQVKFEVPDPDVNSDDIASIRQALGLKDEESRTFESTPMPTDEKAEEPTVPIITAEDIPAKKAKSPAKEKKKPEKKHAEPPKEQEITAEEFPEDSLELPPPPDQDIDADAKKFVDQISPKGRSKPEGGTRYDNRQKQKKAAENYFSDLDNELEKTKADLIRQAKDKKIKEGKPLALTTREEKLFGATLKKLIDSYESKTKSKLYLEKTKLKKETAELLKEIKTLEQRDEKLKRIEAKHDEREKRVNEEKKRLEELKDELDDRQIQLEDLSKSLSGQRELHDNLLSQNKNLQKLVNDKKAKLEAKDKEYKLLVKEYESRTSKADKDYRSIQGKSNTLLKTLRAKEDALKQKEKDVQAMLEEERKLFDYLEGTKPASVEPLRKSILEESAIIKDEPQAMPNIDMRPAMQPEPASDEDPIQAKIDDCKELIQEGNLDDAKLLYNDLRKEFMDAEGLKDDEKEKFKHELRELYDEIALGLLRGK